MKTCSKCKEEKHFNEFYTQSDATDGYCCWCKTCHNSNHKKYYLNNKQEISKNRKQYYNKNKEDILQQRKEYYEKNKEAIKERTKKYRLKNKKLVSKTRKKYYEKNKKEILEKGRRLHKEYYKKNKEKINEKHKRYYEENKEKCLLYASEWCKKNPEKAKSRWKNYYENNREKVNKKNKKWWEDHPEKMKQSAKKYRKNNKEKLNKASKNYYHENKEKLRKNYKKWENTKALFSYGKRITWNDYTECSEDGYLIVKCKYCGKIFIPKNKQVRMRIRALNVYGLDSMGLYCSSGCKKSCPTYGRRDAPKQYKPATSREVQPELRQMCLERDEYTCQKCGAKGKTVQLHCHHIYPLNESPITSADIDNTVTLCKKCHKDVHKGVGCRYHELRCDAA